MDLKSARKHISAKCKKTIPITARFTDQQVNDLKIISEHSGVDRSSLICIAVEKFINEYKNYYNNIFENIIT